MSDTSPQIPNYLKFAFGGLSGMGATCVVQPLDLIKNRMQLTGVGNKSHKTSFHLVRSVIKNEGILGLYTGLSAGLLRQATYTTTRLGIYTWLLGYYISGNDNKAPNFLVKACLGMISGMFGAFVGTPAEVALVRMTADGQLPPAERRNYKSVFDAIMKISRQEGVSNLWRGAIPTMSRSMVVNGAQLASYSQTKEILLETGYFRDNITCHFTSSMISGLITTAASMPVDITKTRIQNMKIIDGKPEHKGAIDVMKKVIKNEGVLSLWKGFTPYYARIGPHTVLTFILLEQITGFYYSYVLGDKTGRGSGL
ncbi:hypothetical protein V9T40_012228 [Parthenolecanium corni]|uniref:Mitochondrial 2-oxoglutarate/malate carrier protein n=1 Tax=Parthenolecanium corni TaxID=536013 RepID=A0AAN9XZ50_9HEMI